MLKKNVEDLFEQFNNKESMLNFVKKKSSMFQEILEASLDASHKKSWKAASLLGHIMLNNDKRVRPFIMSFIQILPILNNDGHQRQVLIILNKMQLNNEQKGHLFNYSLSIWEAVHKIPSTRSYAFQTMVKISKSFPELKKELLLFTSDYYSQTLSPGIAISFQKMVSKL